MLNRHSTDKLNPVLYKIIHQSTTTPTLLTFYSVQILLAIGFFIGFKYWEDLGNACNFYLSLSFLCTAVQVFIFAAAQVSERHQDGLDPNWGTRLTPMQIMLGQYTALVLLLLLNFIPILPGYITSLSQPLANPLGIFWSFLLIFIIGITTLAFSCSFSRQRSNVPRRSLSAPALIIPLLFFGNTFIRVAEAFTNTSYAIRATALAVVIPVIYLTITYHYGSYLPLTLECFGLFRKSVLCLIPYALLATILLNHLFSHGNGSIDDLLTYYRIELIVFFCLFALSSCAEGMLPTFRRRLYARKHGKLECLTIFWQIGAVPSYLTAVLVSLVAFAITPPSAINESVIRICSWLIFPLAGLILMFRTYIKGQLNGWNITFAVMGCLLATGFFSFMPISSQIGDFARRFPYSFIIACYIVGISLALPASKKYFRALLSTDEAI